MKTHIHRRLEQRETLDIHTLLLIIFLLIGIF